jgi:hypothetical protein
MSELEKQLRARIAELEAEREQALKQKPVAQVIAIQHGRDNTATINWNPILNGVCPIDIGDSLFKQVQPSPAVAVPEHELSIAEKEIETLALNAPLYPVDATRLKNACIRLIREVRELRNTTPPSAEPPIVVTAAYPADDMREKQKLWNVECVCGHKWKTKPPFENCPCPACGTVEHPDSAAPERFVDLRQLGNGRRIGDVQIDGPVLPEFD